MMIVWIAIGIMAAIAEGLTAAVVSIWFVIGAIFGGAACALGAPVWLQLVLALTSTTGCIILVRKHVLKFTNKNNTALPPNNDTMAEYKRGIVTSTIRPGMEGQVKIEGEYWTATALVDADEIKEGTQIVVVKQVGSKCVVTPVNE